MEPGALIITLGERFGLIVAGAFLLLTLTPIQALRFRQASPAGVTALQILFFGAFGILGTYGGNLVFHSVANLRAMAVITGGLFGGPLVGVGAGLIAGGHRILIDWGGFSAIPCGLATMIEGAAAGLLAHTFKERGVDWRLAALLAVAGESLHMGLVLAFSRPYEEAAELVRIIAMPMIVLNALGAAVFIQVIQLVFRHRAKHDSAQAQQILAIADATVSHLRQGLNLESAQATAKIIYERVALAAVALTDTRNVLAHVGAGHDHHLPGRPVNTRATQRVLAKGQPLFLHGRLGIGCDHPGCPFTSAIVVPLFKNGAIAGTLKFYGTAEKELDVLLFELARGLANLFSTQLELEDIQVKERMLAHAEIRRLQAQINPHFLFNSLNTISSLCRTRPEKARELLQDLSLYMRRNLEGSRGFVSLAEELGQVRSYLAIEQARFGDRVRARISVETGCEDWPIPPLIIQPLVENSVRHGILGREEGGLVELDVRAGDGELRVSIRDDGVGMEQSQIEGILQRKGLDSHREGIGMRNCVQRLEQIFGPKCRMRVTSRPGQGTQVDFALPRLDATT